MTLLLRVTLAFAAGLLPGLRWGAGWSSAAGWLPFLAAAVLAAAWLLARGTRTCAIAGFVCLGTVVGALRAAGVAADCRTGLPDGTHVRLVGVPVALPVPGLAVMVHGRLEGAASCAATFRVHVPERHHDRFRDAALGEGPALAVAGRWAAYPARNGWPRRPEHAGGVLLDSVAGDANGIAPPLTRFRAARQEALRQAAPRQWPLAEAILLAQKSGLAPETRARWAAAGLVHLLAISGMHVGLIAAGVLGIARLGGVPRRRARRLALLLTGVYVLFLGAPHAALRALLQALLLLVAVELQRPAEPFSLVAAAALAILLVDPLAVLDPGFQLSFAGIVGLVAWRRPLLERLPRRIPRVIREGIAAGTAASALTTPIAALHFGQAAWIGIPASIIATPVLAAAIGALVFALVAGPLAGVPPGILAHVTQPPLVALDRIAEAAARVPGGHTFLAPVTVLVLLAATAFVILLRRTLAPPSQLPPPSHAPAHVHDAFAARARAARLRLAIAMAAGLLIVSWAPALIRAGSDRVEVHAIDVGQGDAFAVRTPRGRWILVDAGPRTPRSDAGRDRVAPFLQKRGVRRIEVLVLTHPDADHIGGAAAVLDAFDVGVVVDPGLAAGKTMFIDLLAAARSGRQRWIAARAGMRFRIDGVEVEFLYPFPELDAPRDANDNSVVFRLTFGRFAALFLGDAPMAVEEQLVARYGNGLRAAVLKVGHHGSTTSTGDVLLAAARPEIALVSAGRRNRYGHPAPVVLRRLLHNEVRVLRTDELGSITVRAARDGRIRVHARR